MDSGREEKWVGQKSFEVGDVLGSGTKVQ